MATPNHTDPPSLARLFVSFASIGLMSFGGGLAAWTRREVVEKRAWLEDRQFLSGYAISQLIPGATNVNLAVFIGTLLRGKRGALACFLGLTALPLVVMVTLGLIYLRSQDRPGGVWMGTILAGMGAVAIGLNLGIGLRLGRRNITGAIPFVIAAAVALAIGILGFPLLEVLLIALPLSLLLAWLTHRPR